MQPLNYCGKASRYFEVHMKRPPVAFDQHERWSHCVALCRAVQKFMLPEGGIALEDLEMRGLAADVPLSLPFDSLALEFNEMRGLPGSQCILLAWQSEDFIYCRLVVRLADDPAWIPLEAIRLGRVGGILGAAPNGVAVVACCFVNHLSVAALEMTRIPTVAVLLSFMNALACSNVAVERLSSTQRTAGAAMRGDSYHVLVIRNRGGSVGGCDTSHRSPREHVRRGHIRRMQDGRRIWVNVCVVARGAPGKITKDYALLARAKKRPQRLATPGPKSLMET